MFKLNSSSYPSWCNPDLFRRQWLKSPTPTISSPSDDCNRLQMLSFSSPFNAWCIVPFQLCQTHTHTLYILESCTSHMIRLWKEMLFHRWSSATHRVVKRCNPRIWSTPISMHKDLIERATFLETTYPLNGLHAIAFSWQELNGEAIIMTILYYV